MALRLLPVLMLAVALAACGGDDEAEPTPATTVAATTEQGTTTESGGETSAALIAAAASQTAETGSSRVSVSASIGGRSFSGEGAYDYDDHTGEMTLDLSGLGGGAGLGSVELVFADYVVYYHLPAGLLPAGKEWMKVDLKALGNVSGIDLQQLAQGNQSDPGQYLEWLKAVEGNVEEVGTETVRGVETTHYRATIELDEVVETALPEVREATRVWIDILKRQLELGEVPVDVWVDGDGLVRRMQQRYQLGNTETEITMELYDFGVEVDPEVPSPDQIIDLGDLVGQL